MWYNNVSHHWEAGMRSTPDRNISSFNLDAVLVVFLYERGSSGRSELVALQSNQMITTGEGTWPNSWYSWSGGALPASGCGCCWECLPTCVGLVLGTRSSWGSRSGLPVPIQLVSDGASLWYQAGEIRNWVHIMIFYVFFAPDGVSWLHLWVHNNNKASSQLHLFL